MRIDVLSPPRKKIGLLLSLNIEFGYRYTADIVLNNVYTSKNRDRLIFSLNYGSLVSKKNISPQ